MLSKFSVNKPYTVIVAVIIVLVLGFVAFGNLNTDLLPPMDLPYAVVVTAYGGAMPEEVETTVTKPVEQGLASVSNLKNIMSVSMDNMSLVMLEFYQDTDIDSVTLEMREKLDLISAIWTDDMIGSPMIVKLNPDMMPLMAASVDLSGKSAAEVSSLLNGGLLDELQSVEGVASITPIGLVVEQVDVTISQEKLDALNQRIMDAIDGDFNEARAALADARSQLDAASAHLEAELAAGQQQIDDGQQQLSAGYEQLNDADFQLEQKIDELDQQRQQVVTGRDALQQQKETLTAQAQQLETLGDSRTDVQELQLQSLYTSIQALDKKIAEAQANIDAIDEGLTQAQSGKEELEIQRGQLDEQQAALDASKETMAQKATEAQDQIGTGLSQINASYDEIESQEESAKDQAEISNIITAEMIEGILAAQNFSMPAGAVTNAETDEDASVKVGDKIQSPEELNSLFLFHLDLDDIGDIALADVADISFTDNSDEMYAKVNGNEGVLLTFLKQSTYSTTQVCDALNEKIAELEEKYDGLTILPLMDQGQYIHIVTDSVMHNLLMGAVLAILILFLFLRSVKPTLVIAISIPASLLFAIVLMYFSGVTLNIISLSGLALGVGMLVDNSIVVIENIYRLRLTGVSAHDAAISGAKQVGGAITASTLTTISVFVPILFTHGLAKELFLDMGLTIAYSLIASLLVALSLVPALSYGVLRNVRSQESRLLSGLKRVYTVALRWTLGHRALTLIAVLVLFVGSMIGAFASGTSFIPEADSVELTANVKMNDNEATTNELWAASDEVMARIMAIDDVDAVGAIAAGDESFMSMGTEAGMNFYIRLKDDKTLTSQEVARQIEGDCSDLDCTVTTTTSGMDMTALGGSGVIVSIEGADVDTLQNIAIDFEKIMGGIEGVEETSDTEVSAVDELVISVDKTKAMEHELTVAQVYSIIAETTASTSSATTLSFDGVHYDVIVSDETATVYTDETLGDIVLIAGEDGAEDVTVDDVATVRVQKSAAAIAHYNQNRYTTVSAMVDSEHSITQVADEIKKALAEYEMPDNYSYEMSGESVTIDDVLTDLIKAILVGILLIYLIMVAQFQSLRLPFIVIFTVPLAFTGGFLALLICGMDVSIIAMLGLLVLAGVVVNNGIVLVDYVNQLRRAGRSKRDALFEGGCTRMRPILMTAFTTILALITLAFGVGMGAEMVQPMAVVTIGGLLYATLLTLFVIPVIYDLIGAKDRPASEAAAVEPSVTGDRPAEAGNDEK